MAREDFSYTTKIRFLINKLLTPVGFQVSTLTKDQVENEKLNQLKNRGHWQQPKYSRGLHLNDNNYLNLLQDDLFIYRNEFINFSATTENNNTNNYYLNNEFFSTGDAEVLYGFIRTYKPANIVEVGSGFSTRLMRKAVDDGKLETKIICIDPQPRVDILEHADEHFSFYIENLEPDKLIKRINAGDFLFIDSSHIVSTGGDVNFLFLEILPQLPVGCIIHIHDIYFPYDYPEEWVIDEKWGWNEQYLVHAFLMFNDCFEILWPSHYMWVNYRTELEKVFSTRVNNYKPSSIWIKRIK